MMDEARRARLDATVARDARVAVRALAAAERAVEEGRLNLAKVLRASAHASRRRALILERILLAGADASTAAGDQIAGIVAGRDALAIDREPDPAVGLVAAVLDAEHAIMRKTLDALASARDVSESIVAQFVWGCAECGWLAEADRPEICPACGAFSAEFEMFAPFFSATADHLLRREPEELRRMLAADPDALRRSLDVADDAVLRARAGDGEWCAAEIAGHMIDIAEVTARRLRAVVEPETPMERDRHVLPWKLLEGQGYDVMPAGELTARFAAQIAEVLALMSRLDDTAWRKKTEWLAGRVSAVDLGSWLANHNVAHRRQIDAIVTGQ